MGWKGTLRSIAAAQRRAVRAEQQHQRQLLNTQVLQLKVNAMEQAFHSVQVYQSLIQVLQSVHKDSSEPWDWQKIKATEPPPRPIRTEQETERAAQYALDTYKPSLLDKTLRRGETKRSQLAGAVVDAKRIADSEYEQALQQHDQDLAEWHTLQRIADGVLAGDVNAYMDAIRETAPFAEISELGSQIMFRTDDRRRVEATLHVNGEKVIPTEVFSLLATGYLSRKPMPKTQFYALYQDHVCSCVLRVARELFALLPIDMVFVDAMTELLNPATGHMEEQPILSVVIPRKTLNQLNFETIDCSDAMQNFVHRMKFQKTKGLSAVEMLSPAMFEQPTA